MFKIELYTIVSNLTAHPVNIRWANTVIPPNDYIRLEGAWPTACSNQAFCTDIECAIAKGVLELELYTNLPTLRSDEPEAITPAEHLVQHTESPSILSVVGPGLPKVVIPQVRVYPDEPNLPPEIPAPPPNRKKLHHAFEVVDGIPQMVAASGDLLLHISKFPKQDPPPGRACIVGKGPSMMEWRNVPDVDVYFTINEATYAVDRQHFHCRGDVNRKGHRFCDWLPPYAVPIVPERIKDYYNYGYWFKWEDIGSNGICLTAIEAIRLAYWMGCRDIVLCGLDALRTGDTSYDPLVQNERNAKHKIRDQKDRMMALPRELQACCRNFDGTPLVNPALLG